MGGLRGRRGTRLSSAATGLLLVGVVLSSGGCPKAPEGLSTMPVVATDDPQAEADLKAAREAHEAGRLDEAESRYARFLTDHPHDPLAAVARMALGRIALDRGRDADALTRLEALVDHPDPALARRARFYTGVALHRTGEHARALTRLEPFVDETVDPDDTTLLLRTLAAAAIEVGDRARAITAYDQLATAAVPETDRHEARERLDPLVAEATPEEVEHLFEALPSHAPAWPLVASRLAHLAYGAGDYPRAREVLAAVRARDVPFDEALEALAIRLEEAEEVRPRVVGAILPLSGRGREVGQLALRGVLLAAGETDGSDASAREPFEVVFRDDGGDPRRAAQAVDDLVTSHRPIAIIGPIGGEAAAAAARRAQALGVPLVSLAPVATLPATGPMVFRLLFTPEDEARELVAAARRRGARRFAILHPSTPFGQRFRQAYEAQVLDHGGEMVAAVAYDRGTTSFAKPVEQLPAARLDAILVADGAATVQLVAPALAAAGLWSRPPGEAAPPKGRAVTLLLPSVGYGPDVLRTSGRYLQGALVSRPFDPESGAGRGFAARFDARFGSAPDVFAAYAYDALTLVREATDAGARTRPDLAQALATGTRRNTVGGSGGLGAERGAARGTRVLEVRGNRLVPVDLR